MKNSPKKPAARFSRLRLGLFGVMFLAVMMLGSRVFDSAQMIISGKLPDISPVHAADDPKKDVKADVKAEAKTDAKPADAKPADAKPAEAKPADTKPADVKPADAAAPAAAPAATPAAAAPEAAPSPPPVTAAPPAEAPPVQDATMIDPDSYSDAEVNILKRLSERRQELDKRGRELDQREALMKVTESRVDRKINDLKTMQDDVRKIIGEADDKQKAQTASMVKIYETMKPKEAAQILEKLDITTMVHVVSRMKEARVAPMMAAMDPGKAKELTSAMMEHKALPTPP